MHTEVKKMEERLPSDELSGSPPDVLENQFASLDIGTRKRTMRRMHSKESEKLVEDALQDINVLDPWNSLDKISFDDSESSEWERSNSSSLSWFDESEQETTLKVKSMMDNIDKALYGEPHLPLPKVVAEECQQWKLRFPHLRVVGKAVSANCVEVPTRNSSLPVNNVQSADGNYNHTCNGQEINTEEDQEETYASHGTIEHEPMLSHELQTTTEPSMCHEVKMIQEALVDELTKHVWKEVVEPKIKEFMEKNIRGKEIEGGELSFCKRSLSETFVAGGTRILEPHVKDKSITFTNTQAQLPQSARESSNPKTAAESFYYEPIQRRHSDQSWISHRKSKNRLAPDRISEERDESEDIVANNAEILYGNALEAENRMGFDPRMPDIDGFQRGTYKKLSQSRERLHFPSPSYLKSSEVTEELNQLDLSVRSYSQRRNNETIKNSVEHYPHSKPRHVKLPNIEDYNKAYRSTSNEAKKSLHVRSSSALPKLAPRNLRPTMSSYKNMLGERASSVMKHPPHKNESSPVRVNIDGYGPKFNRNRQSNTLRARKEKLKKDKYSDL